MEKKKKIFYLDFIRVLSMVMIVTYHFYAHFPENNINGYITIFSNGKWGLIGVALFFMISGASLMYNYKDKLELKSYIKKRFIGIYPMFWMAYIILYVYLFYCSKQNLFGLPSSRLIISAFAMDGYLSSIVKTCYLIGEWFLGCIVLIYIIFPVLRLLVNKYPKISFIVMTCLNFVILLFYTNGIIPINQNLIVSLYSFMLGMYLINIIEFKLWQAILSFIIVPIFYLLPAKNMNIQVLYANISAYAFFILLAYIGQKINIRIIQKVFITISKYSYAIFLVHHYIIMKVESTFQNKNFGISGTCMLYITIWLIIVLFSKLLYKLNKDILNFFKKDEDENNSGHYVKIKS